MAFLSNEQTKKCFGHVRRRPLEIWNVMWTYNGDGTTDKTRKAENEVNTHCRET